MPVPKDVVDKLIAELAPDELEEVCKLLGIMNIAPQPPATLTPKTETPVAPQSLTLQTPKEETRGERTIKIFTRFKADASDISNTAILVLDLGLLTLGTVKLGKKDLDVLQAMVNVIPGPYRGNVVRKMVNVGLMMEELEDPEHSGNTNVGVLREMVKQFGIEYLGAGLETLDQVGRERALANLKTEIEKGFLVYEIIRYKRWLSIYGKNEAKNMPQAA